MTFVTILVTFTIFLMVASVLGSWIPDLRRSRGATSARESRRKNDRNRDSDLFDRRQDRAREFRERIRRERQRRDGERPSRAAGAPPPSSNALSTSAQSKDSRFRETLEIGNGPISPELLRRQYRALMAAYHPDRVSGLGRKLQELAEEESKSINEAHLFFKAQLSSASRVETADGS